MWFKNIKTGLVWHISHQNTIERLLKDSDYEVFELLELEPESEQKEEVKPKRKKRGE